jgi:hypothetical protein
MTVQCEGATPPLPAAAGSHSLRPSRSAITSDHSADRVVSAISRCFLKASSAPVSTVDQVAAAINQSVPGIGAISAARHAILRRIQQSAAAAANASVARVLLPSERNHAEGREYERACKFLFGNRIHEWLNTAIAAYVNGAVLARAEAHYTCDGELDSTLAFEALPEVGANVTTPIADCVHSFEDTVSNSLRLRAGKVYTLNTCTSKGRTFSAARFQGQELGAGSALDPELFALGANFLYGTLFLHFFRFRSPTAIEHGLLRADDVVRISVHLRHRSTRFNGSEMVEAALREVDRLAKGRTCQVLLAADRRLTIELMHRSDCTCRVTHIPRPSNEQSRPEHFRENGPDSGDTAFRDMELLTNGHHLVGTYGSTYTMLIEEVIAARWSGSELTIPTVTYCDPLHGCMKRGLPLITDASNSWHTSLQRWPEANLRMGSHDPKGSPTTDLASGPTIAGAVRGLVALPTRRVALQLSGHLRDLCCGYSHAANGTGTTPLVKLVSQVNSCRRHAICDVYLHTWDRLFPGTSTWHNNDRAFCKEHMCQEPTAAEGRFESSQLCVSELSRALEPRAITVDRQPLDPGQVWSDVGNATWCLIHKSKPGCSTRGVSLAGSKAMIHGIAAAAQMRQSHARHPYDLAVRLRVDVHRYGVTLLQGCAWPLMLDTVANGKASDTGVYSCGMQPPGGKNSDTCLWGAPRNMDLLIQTWNATARDEMMRNMCFALHGRRHGAARCGVANSSLQVAQTAEELLKAVIARAHVEPRAAFPAMLACWAH